MAYGLRYTISQLLRDDTTLDVKIYEKDYSGSTKIYEAVNINLESNSSGDEPLPALVSSQLNVSFLISEEDAASDFPALLSFDDRKYFVKLYNGATLLWSGFLFNDYVSLPFTTGFVQVDIVAIDGLSFLEYTTFNFITDENINSTTRLIDVIGTTLNIINYPDPIELFTSCSYYAEGMFDRGDASGDEPFSQSYIYRRDLQGKTYYEVLENIVRSFGCRLFQSDGKWQLLAINQMALATRYYTNYVIYPTVSVAGSGTFNKNITIEPYALGNVHFVDNAQSKLVRKGYPKLVLKHSFDYPSNYVHNGTFKGINGNPATPTTTSLYGWLLTSSTGTFPSNLITVLPESNFNTVELFTPLSGSNRLMSIENGPPVPLDPYLYAPYMTGPSFTVSLEHRLYVAAKKAKLQITIKVGSTIYYYNTSNTWQTTPANVIIEQPSTDDYVYDWTKYSITVSMTTPAIPVGVGTSWAGYVKIKIYVDDNSTYSTILMRNIQITQGSGNVSSLEVTRQVGTGNTTVKEEEQPYGTFYTFPYTASPIYSNTLGVLYDISGNVLKNWYRYPRTESFSQLQMLIARQLSNLLNKNFATLEAQLGTFQTVKGLNYLDKVYSIQDASTNALSYNGLKFLMNRGQVIPRTDEVASFQVIEVTDTDNTSTESVKYIDQ